MLPILLLRQELLLLSVEVLLDLRTFGAVPSLRTSIISRVVTDIWLECAFLHFSLKIFFLFSSLELSQLSISILFVPHHSFFGLLCYVSLPLLVSVIGLEL